jgi:hypothetical protein
MHTDEPYRQVAERCLRMAEFSERSQSVASLRQIAADYLDMADEKNQDQAWQLRAGRRGDFKFSGSETPKAGIVAGIYAKIKRAIQSITIVIGAILLGISVVAALIFAEAPAGARVASGQQIECMYREIVSLNWPRDMVGFKSYLEPISYLEPVQKFCGRESLRHYHPTSGGGKSLSAVSA